MARAGRSQAGEAIGPQQHEGDAFRQFLEAEMNAILASMNERDRTNSDRCNSRAMEWIAQNAAQFRKAWYDAVALCGDGASAGVPKKGMSRNA